MTRSALEFTRETPEGTGGTIAVYAVSGSLCGTTTSYELLEEIRGQIAGGTNRIVIDLARAEKIDSCGIGILAAVMWSASQAGAGMVLASLSPKVEKVLSIAMLLDHIDHAATVDDALARLDRSEREA